MFEPTDDPSVNGGQEDPRTVDRLGWRARGRRMLRLLSKAARGKPVVPGAVTTTCRPFTGS